MTRQLAAARGHGFEVVDLLLDSVWVLARELFIPPALRFSLSYR